MAAGDYTYDEDEQKLKINYLGSIFGASIEDFAECMADVLDKILEVKNVKTIILTKDREYEYGPEQTEMLVEVARVIEEAVTERLMTKIKVTDNTQKKLFPEVNSRMQEIKLS